MGGPGSGRRPGGGSKGKLKLQKVTTGKGKMIFRQNAKTGGHVNALPKQNIKEKTYSKGNGWLTKGQTIKKTRGY
jgi:hypothetical protein